VRETKHIGTKWQQINAKREGQAGEKKLEMTKQGARREEREDKGNSRFAFLFPSFLLLSYLSAPSPGRAFYHARA